jgi:hypothetical protein
MAEWTIHLEVWECERWEPYSFGVDAPDPETALKNARNSRWFESNSRVVRLELERAVCPVCESLVPDRFVYEEFDGHCSQECYERALNAPPAPEDLPGWREYTERGRRRSLLDY